MIRIKTVALFALFSVFCTACATQDAPDLMVRSDSADIQIVESRAAAWANSTPWRFSPQPIFTTGVPAGDSLLEFNRIRRAIRLHSGYVAVANGRPANIRVIDDRGVVIRSIGRQGEGPGEFRSLDWIEATDGDTILALDSQGRRISAFGSDGALAWSMDIREGTGTPRSGALQLDDGTLVLHRGESDALSKVAQGTEQTGQTLRNTARVLRYDRSGNLLNPILITDGLESSMFVRDGLPAMAQAPFGRDLVYAVSNGGVLIGTQEAHELREYTPEGVLRRIIRWTGPDLAITAQDMESLKADYLAQTQGDPQAERRLEQLLAEIPFPPSKAAYGRLLVDAEGFLWVAAAANPGKLPAHWNVFSDDGDLLGTIAMPPDFQLQEAGTDYVLGVCRNADGVEFVCSYALDRSPTAEIA